MKNMEISILRTLWAQPDSVTTEAIVQATGSPPADVTTALADMAGRGLVALEGSSYRPLFTATEYCAAEVRGLVDQLYGGDAVAFLADYISTAGPEDRAALEDAINKGDRQS